MKEKNILNLAKGNTKKLPATEKKEKIKEEPIIPKTPEEARDLKAKKKVEELLSDVDLTINKEPIVEVIEEKIEEVENNKGNSWLEEQVALLSSENEQLRIELGDYLNGNINNNSNNDKFLTQTYEENIISLYRELKNNRINWTTVKIDYLLGKLNQLFPFTTNY